MTEELADKKCVPCRGGLPPLTGAELAVLHHKVPEWIVEREASHSSRGFPFSRFQAGSGFRESRRVLLLKSRDIIPTFCWRAVKPTSLCGRTRLTACPRATSSWLRRLTAWPRNCESVAHRSQETGSAARILAARSDRNSSIAGSSMIAPVVVATVRAEYPASRKTPAR